MSDVKQMNFEPAEFETYRLIDGDILLAEASGSASAVGKPAIWRSQVLDCCFQNTLIRVRPAAQQLSRFLHAHFLRDVHTGAFAAASRGVGIHHLGAEAITSWSISLPPQGERERVVEAVELQLSRIDAAIATLERVERNLKRYRASVLKAAVEGRLVPTEAELAQREGRSFEPASELLERILSERRRRWEEAELARLTSKGTVPTDSRWKSKYAGPFEAEVAGLSVLPEGWCWSALAQLCDSVTDGDHLPPPQSSTGVPFLVIGNVRTGEVTFDGSRFVSPEYFEQLDPRRKPRCGDVLYTVTGSFGIPVHVRSNRPFCVQRHIAILRPSPTVSADLLVQFLGSNLAFRQADAMATGTAQKTVPLQLLRRMVLPLPPLAEQSRIVAEVSRLLSVADAVTETVASELARCTRLRQSILKAAFEGKLVDQDPSDEPASVLLERIRAERAASAEAGAKRPRRAAKRDPA